MDASGLPDNGEITPSLVRSKRAGDPGQGGVDSPGEEAPGVLEALTRVTFVDCAGLLSCKGEFLGDNGG